MDLFDLDILVHHLVDLLPLRDLPNLLIVRVLVIIRDIRLQVSIFNVNGGQIHSLIGSDPLTDFITSIVPVLHPKVEAVVG